MTATTPETHFPAAYVKELRGKADRYRRRARVLERLVIIDATTKMAERQGIKCPLLSPELIDRAHVDDNGVVHGVPDILAALK